MHGTSSYLLPLEEQERRKSGVTNALAHGPEERSLF